MNERANVAGPVVMITGTTRTAVFGCGCAHVANGPMDLTVIPCDAHTPAWQRPGFRFVPRVPHVTTDDDLAWLATALAGAR
jgi:hypothetical protein